MSKILPAAALFATIALLACEEDSPILNVTPKMEFEPKTLDFESVQIGTRVTEQMQVKNPGSGLLTLVEVAQAMPANAAFSFACGGGDCAGERVAAGGVGIIDVTFAPTALGPHGANIAVTPDAPDLGVGTFAVTGVGVTADLEVEPEAAEFGNVVTGTTKTLGVMITNVGPVSANVRFTPGDAVTFCSAAGGGDTPFCVASTDRMFDADGRFDLDTMESTTINVSFSPTINGTQELGAFTLHACGTCEPVIVNMDGVGVPSGFLCDPASLGFGPTNPQSCVTKPVTCSNVANEDVTVVDWGLDRDRPSDPSFSVAEFTTVTDLAEGESVDVPVTYCPDDLGTHRGWLAVETDNTAADRRFVRVALGGNGGGPDIDVTPLVLDFGRVSLMAPSRRVVQIANVGYAELEVMNVVNTATGTFSAPSVGRFLSRGGVYDLIVEFQPTSAGRVGGELIINSDDQDEPAVHVQLIGQGVPVPACEFQVVPDRMRFGIVQRGRTTSRAFEVRNTGMAECIVTSARVLPSSDAEFSLPDGDVRSLSITPGAAGTIRVAYTPTTAATNRGQVEFGISDPRSPFNLVDVVGTGADAALLIAPRELDFGTIADGCRARNRTITMYNTGTVDAQINSITVADAHPAFTIERYPTPLPGAPVRLSPGASASFEVTFRADRISSYAGAVEIVGSFAGQPVTYLVSMIGRGDRDAVQIDEFDQLGQPKVDILMVVDDSCSMSQEQSSIGSNFGAFIQFSDAQSLDYQIAVSTTDIGPNGPAGRFVPLNAAPLERIVTPNTRPSPEAVFTQNVNVGIAGSGTEAGLHAAFLALSNPLIFGHNGGFLRPDAVLSIVFVSDEDDHSPSSLDFYVNFFLSIKGFRNANLFSASAIVGDPGGCSGNGGAAQPGPRYLEFAARTGGVFQSICTGDWNRSLEDLSTTAFGFKSRFFLTNQPVVASLRVVVDGVEVPGTGPDGTVNWDYDLTTNSINFGPFSTPEPGAHIRAEYTVDCLQ